MKILKVDTMKQPYLKDIGDGLEDLQAEVGGRIEAFYPFEDDVAVICNEDGKINGMKPNRPVFDNEEGRLLDIVYGDFAVVGLSRSGFRSISPVQCERYTEEFRVPYKFFEENGRKCFLPVFGQTGRETDECAKTIKARAVSDTFPGRSAEISFPLSDEKFALALKEASMECGSWHFEGYECPVPEVTGILMPHESFDDVNDLAFAMSCLTDEGMEKMGDILRTGCIADASGMLSVASGLDDFDIIEGIRSDSELASWFLSDSGLVDTVTADLVSDAVDLDKLGRSLRERDISGIADGVYTDKGYVYEIFDSEFMRPGRTSREAEI